MLASALAFTGFLQFLVVLFWYKLRPILLSYFETPYSQDGVIVFSTDDGKNRTTCSEVYVEAVKANCILGPGNEILKTIGRKHNAKVILVPSTECDEEDKVRRIIVIGGWQAVALAQREVRLLLSTQEQITTEIFYVPAQSVGVLIGKGGANVKELSRLSCARINISSADRSEAEASVILRGTIDAVNKAKKLLEQKVIAWKTYNWHA